MNGLQRHGSQDGSSDQDPTYKNISNRKKEDHSSPHTRAKRNRYVTIACNQCKRRKIRCNGEIPCRRCGNMSLECQYEANCCTNGFKDTEDFHRMNDNIQSLQEQVNHLYASLNALVGRSDGKDFGQLHPAPLPQALSGVSSSPILFQQSVLSPDLRARSVPFHGPTTSAFDFDIANSSLRTMGITQPTYATDNGSPAHDQALEGQHSEVASPGLQPARSLAKDPLWLMKREDVIRLCRVYDDEIGLLYPILDIEKTITEANVLFNFMDSVVRTGLLKDEIERGDTLHDDDINILKMVLAAAMALLGSGESEIGHRLFNSVHTGSESRLWQPVNLKGLILLVITAEYHFHLGDEQQAYRLIGLAARLCFEMGLHRRDSLVKNITSKEEMHWAMRLFWSVHALDQRWSFGTGMPFAIQEADIDPMLPRPDARTPYLAAMVPYSQLAARAWRSIVGFEGSSTSVKKNEIAYLDYQIKQWLTTIPEDLQYHFSDNYEDRDSLGRGHLRLRILLYLRANNLRAIIHMPVLHCATSIMENQELAQRVVNVAKDSIKALVQLNQTSNIYLAQQICFNYFLISALAILFLAVAHAPLEFNRQVRDEFYMALDLVKGFSTRSSISRRLWQTIKGLKEIVPKLGLISRQGPNDMDDPHSSAAFAMAGLAGHQVDEQLIITQVQDPGLLDNSLMDGQQMSYELTNLFEAAAGFSKVVPADGTDGFAGVTRATAPGFGGMSGMYGNEEEFARLMKHCF